MSRSFKKHTPNPDFDHSYWIHGVTARNEGRAPRVDDWDVQLEAAELRDWLFNPCSDPNCEVCER